MSDLSWPEIKDRAIAFSREWAGETREAAESQTFWNDFFTVFGLKRRVLASFQEPVRNLHGRFNRIDLLWRGTMLVEHKSLGESIDAAALQAFDYIQDLARDGRSDDIPRYIIVSDFARIALYDLEPDEQRPLPLFAGLRYDKCEFPLQSFTDTSGFSPSSSANGQSASGRKIRLTSVRMTGCANCMMNYRAPALRGMI